MTDISIAVVIPSYNRARYLVDTLRTIYTQTHKPKRVIVIDDGSTDDTLEAIAPFKSETPALEIIRQQNKGPAAARNAGIFAADDCSWIAFCDSDDVWHPEKLAEQIKIIRHTALKNVGCVYVNTGHIDANGAVAPGHGHPALYGSCLHQIQNGTVPTGSMASVMIRRDLLLSVGAFDENMRSDEDLELMIRLAPVCVFDFTTRILASIRLHPDKSSNDALKLYRTKSYILNKHPLFFSSTGPFMRYIRYEIFMSAPEAHGWDKFSFMDKLHRFPRVFSHYRQVVNSCFTGSARARIFPTAPSSLALIGLQLPFVFGKKLLYYYYRYRVRARA